MAKSDKSDKYNLTVSDINEVLGKLFGRKDGVFNQARSTRMSQLNCQLKPLVGEETEEFITTLAMKYVGK